MFTPESCQSLSQVYPAVSHSDAAKAVDPTLLKAEQAALYGRLHRSVLGCMPMLSFDSKSPTVQQCLKNKWIWRIASYLSCSLFPKCFRETCDREVETAIGLMQDIAKASEEACPHEAKAFLLQNLLSHVIAYRPSHYFQEHPDSQLIMPVRKDGKVVIKPCRFEREVNLFGGVMAKIFVPCDGKGSAVYLFSGTTPWLLADGAGISLLDDFNPAGPGEGLRMAARHRLKPFLEQHMQELGEPSLLVGHSLGGIIITSLAVDLPQLIGQVVAFNASRSTYRLAHQWSDLQLRVSKTWSQTLPKIDTFVSHYHDHPDLVSYVGSCWIGNVYRVSQCHEPDLLHRHVNVSSGGATVTPINIAEANRRAFRYYGWAAVIHTLIVLPLAITTLVLVTLKRFLVGWNAGGVWRWGVFGVPYYLSLGVPRHL